MLRPLVRGQSRYEGSIGNSNGLFHRPRAPTPYRATWPPSPWCWGLPARPAPHALAGHSLERARGSLRHREPPRRPGTRGEPQASAAAHGQHGGLGTESLRGGSGGWESGRAVERDGFKRCCERTGANERLVRMMDSEHCRAERGWFKRVRAFRTLPWRGVMSTGGSGTR